MTIPPEEIHQAKILIVDDNASNVELLAQLLKLAGYTSIHKTRDSRKAADLYRQIRPDLVLLDINMPHLNGYQVMEQLKEIEKPDYAPVMVLTAQADLKTRVKALQEGARDFLTKPFDQLEIQIRIRSMLEIRLLSNFVRDQNKLLEEKVRERTLDLAVSNVNLMDEIEKREAAEAALRQYANDLEMKNQELNDFVHIASHDLQEPLRRIITFGDLIKNRSKNLDEKEIDYIDRMQKSTARMKKLIEDLLDFCRITSRENPFEETNLERVIADVASDLEMSITETGAQINVGKLPTLKLDSVQIRQLFQNLISNAIKYRKESVAPVITLDSRCLDDGNWEITVEDNGIGFNERYRNLIFQPFERLHAKDEFEGNGMGLAICRNIVMRHGGSIVAESQPGKGTKFIIVLPGQSAKTLLAEKV